MINNGVRHLAATRVATEPKIAAVNAPRPCEPITSKSSFPLLA
jgi:hypothetical protein